MGIRHQAIGTEGKAETQKRSHEATERRRVQVMKGEKRRAGLILRGRTPLCPPLARGDGCIDIRPCRRGQRALNTVSRDSRPSRGASTADRWCHNVV